MALSDIKIKTAKPLDKPYKLSDSGGLYLIVNRNGSKYWRMKYRFAGKEKMLSIGVYQNQIIGWQSFYRFYQHQPPDSVRQKPCYHATCTLNSCRDQKPKYAAF
ncbi:hypothetical protein OO7_02066 [Providencia sneebia DSM 19967]|uniref:Integrase DNA-binding domain-containing protein n=1 Tax=Providencia sneebia DSM 19967 TaxID=1141660 RepID=K8WJX5_9GAMM|nr:hypothetical protein OO7_02066 [Providencia sneebia DSM 19967]